MSCGMSCVKCLLCFFNLLFLVSGVLIVLIAGIVLHNFSNYELFFGGNISAVCMLLVIVGAIVFVVAFFGCCGALKENRFMITTFSVLLFILFAVEIAAGIAGYVLKDVIKNDLGNQLNSTLFKYEYNNDTRKTWDTLQTDFHCCGISGPDDWITAQLKIPTSCCRRYGYDDIEDCTEPPYQEGCLDSLKQFISGEVSFLGIFGIGIAISQLVGILLACCLAESVRKGYGRM